MRERITVEARFEAEGRILPQAFEWRGRRFRVASLGRVWREAAQQHFLVMTPEEQVYELAYGPPTTDGPRPTGTDSAAGEWWLLRAPGSPSGAVLV